MGASLSPPVALRVAGAGRNGTGNRFDVRPGALRRLLVGVILGAVACGPSPPAPSSRARSTPPGSGRGPAPGRGPRASSADAVPGAGHGDAKPSGGSARRSALQVGGHALQHLHGREVLLPGDAVDEPAPGDVDMLGDLGPSGVPRGRERVAPPVVDDQRPALEVAQDLIQRDRTLTQKGRSASVSARASLGPWWRKFIVCQCRRVRSSAASVGSNAPSIARSNRLSQYQIGYPVGPSVVGPPNEYPGDPSVVIGPPNTCNLATRYQRLCIGGIVPRKRPSGERVQEDEHVKAVERAMVAIRRSQTRRALTRLADGRDDADDSGVVGGSAVDVLDAIEAAEQAGIPATVSGVAAALNVNQTRASKHVAAAVEAGLVRREADHADGRRAPLIRTERGK